MSDIDSRNQTYSLLIVMTSKSLKSLMHHFRECKGIVEHIAKEKKNAFFIAERDRSQFSVIMCYSIVAKIRLNGARKYAQVRVLTEVSRRFGSLLPF